MADTEFDVYDNYNRNLIFLDLLRLSKETDTVELGVLRDGLLGRLHDRWQEIR